MKIIVFSNNKKKLQELNDILGFKGQSPFTQTLLKICSYSDFFKKTFDIIENGQTFEQNALKKVLGLPATSEGICLADDSGLEVEALDGAPGVHSARYAGENPTTEKLCHKLLTELQGATNRKAKFTTVIALRFTDNTVTTVEGTVTGQIIHELRGTNGFGYDPVFVPDGFDQTYAELSVEIKNQISHRARALALAQAKIEDYLAQKSKTT